MTAEISSAAAAAETRWQRIGGLFAFSAVLGSFFDAFHTRSGATAYPHPAFLGMAWWTPLLFGTAGVAIALSHVSLDGRLHRPVRSLSSGALLAGLSLFGLGYYESGFWTGGGGEKLALLLALWLGLWGILDRSWQGALLALGTGLMGCVVERVLVHLGAFSHLRPDGPDWVRLPLWLPALYMLASLAVGNLGRRLLP